MEEIKELLFGLNIEELEEVKRIVEANIANRKRRAQLVNLLSNAK